jgi:nicotinamidase-related amidase
MGESAPSSTARAVLLVIDMQRAIDDPSWATAGPRNNLCAESNVARLLAAWRAAALPMIHLRHASKEPDSTFRPDGQGAAFKPEAAPKPGETVLSKSTANAFLSTDLESQLRKMRARKLIVTGMITNNSVESTVRMAAEIGYEVTLAEDAVFTFARRDRRGRLWSAEDVHALSIANLEQGGYARIETTSAILAGLPGYPPCE